MLTAITGINWGDEGKGRMVDLISQEYDIVARYQGVTEIIGGASAVKSQE